MADPVSDDPVSDRWPSTRRIVAISVVVAILTVIGYLVISLFVSKPAKPVAQRTSPAHPALSTQAPPPTALPNPGPQAAPPVVPPAGNNSSDTKRILPAPPPKAKPKVEAADQDTLPQTGSKQATKGHDCAIAGEVPEELKLADGYSSQGRYERAITAYQQVLACEPGNRQAKEGLRNAQNAEKYADGSDSSGIVSDEGNSGLPEANDHTPAPPPSDDEVLNQALARLKKGKLAYNTPEKMKTGQTAYVVARISSNEMPIDALKNSMPSDKGTKTEATQTPVSPKMKMILKSADFDITPLSSEEQFVGGDLPTTWEWHIVPKRSGTLKLHLAAVVELNNLSRDFTTVDKNVTVHVDPVNSAETFAGKNIIWIIGTLCTGIAAAWAWWRRRKRIAAPTWQNP